MKTLQERFWKKVNKDGPVHPIHGPCWIWIAGTSNEDGYGAFQEGAAHRFSWTLHNSAIPEGMCVLHRCDNPPCVNPAHLFLGDNSANVADRMRKGRGYKGESAPQAILTEADVLEIRRRIIKGHPVHGMKPMSREFGVSPGTIKAAIIRKSWKHI